MDIKLIAIDMDGTLLNTKGDISEKNIQALKKALNAGIHIVPATGRVLQILPNPLKKIPEIQYIITSNGAAVYKKGTKTPIYSNAMTIEKTIRVLKLIEPYDTIIEAYIEGNGYFEKQFLKRFQEFQIPENFRKLYEEIKNPVENLIQFIQNNGKEVEKLNIPWLKEGIKQKILNELKEFPDIYITTSLKENVEVNNIGINKGIGLKGLCDVLNLEMENVMAIGDSFNDLEMMEVAGVPVAMENGEKELKEISTFITKSNDNDGVAYAIETLCFGKE